MRKVSQESKLIMDVQLMHFFIDVSAKSPEQSNRFLFKRIIKMHGYEVCNISVLYHATKISTQHPVKQWNNSLNECAKFQLFICLSINYYGWCMK